MEWIERLNNAVNYIEKNIRETIDLEEVSKIACCSTYHFQRMFAYIADIIYHYQSTYAVGECHWQLLIYRVAMKK